MPESPPHACAACHSPLRPEARYCLRCGARRAGARLEFLDVLDVLDEPPGPVAAGAPARRTWPLELTAVVLLALLIGLLTGHWIVSAG
ncbi:hypothetical protein [Baekduia sp. Peel2402]|uniref:hypothetical protein n=1 Tax=Baekduia sp. Peel2402 TaxID=3458296 RepID=UPI00403ED67C